MSKVNINVNNKPFTIACDDGQESRVQQLGKYVDERFRELNQAGAAPNESYTLVLTALVIADDMFDAKDQAEKARLQANSSANRGPSPAEIEAKIRAELSAAYDNHIAGLNAEIARLRQAAQSAGNNVTDLAKARAEAEAALKAREAEIAKVVDAMTERVEAAVKKLKRA
ncbi:MAG: cell division protein ZapA [Alphaproteobacteria bacterium]|nr:cell division protein ZapA [Alphaproteobacteria bacterium]